MNILQLIKLEYRLRQKPSERVSGIIKTILSYLLVVFCSAGVTYMLGFMFQLVASQNVSQNFSLIIFIIQAILFIYSLTSLVKVVFLFRKKDMLAYLPVTKNAIYYSKVIVCFINTFVISSLMLLSSSIVFGIMFNMGVNFYLINLLLIFLVPLLPFGLANLILIPTMYVYNFINNKIFLKLCLIVVVLLVGFYFYMAFVFEFAGLLLSGDALGVNIIEKLITLCSNIYLPNYWISCLAFGVSFWINLVKILLSSISIMVIGLLIGSLSYKNIFNNNLIEKGVSKTINSKTTQRSAFGAYYMLEIKDLFRKSNLLFTYVGMSVAMPVMVYFCNKFLLQFATQKIGNNIVAGTTLFVVLVFVAIICSSTATFISKEGDNFWILKTNPNGIKVPLLAKSCVGITFLGASLIVTIVICMCAKYCSVISGIFIFLTAISFIVGLTCLGLTLNLRWPNIFHAEKENTTNMALLLCFGFLIAIALGIFAIVGSFYLSNIFVLLICFGVAVVFAVITIVILFTQYKRLYAKMEVVL